MNAIILANIATGVAIVDALEFAIRRAWIPDLYLSNVLMIGLLGMCLLSAIGIHFDRADRSDR